VLAHANKPLPTGVELGTNLPRQVEALVKKMAAKNPNDRYQNYDQLITDLRQVKAGFAPSFKPVPSDQKRFRQSFAVLAGILSVAVVAVLIIRGRGKHHSGANFSIANLVESQKTAAIPSSGGPVVNERDRFSASDEFEDPRPPERDGNLRSRQSPSESSPVESAFPSPLAPLPRPDLGSLPDGPLSTVLAEAENYAAHHPTNYRDIVDRYRRALSKAEGTPQEREIDRRMSRIMEEHQQASRKAIREYQLKMDEKLHAGKPQEAFNTWKDFPANLRTLESDQEIQRVLERSLPPGFTPR
jgi:hypothetical protein